MAVDTIDLNTDMCICHRCGELTEMHRGDAIVTDRNGGQLSVSFECGACGRLMNGKFVVEPIPRYNISDRLYDLLNEIDNVMTDEDVEGIRTEIEDIAYELGK